MAEIDVHCVIPRVDGRANEYRLEIEGLARSLPGGHEESPGIPSTGRPTGESEWPAGESEWQCGELHIHSEHSDGRWTIADIAERARGRNLDFLFLTDHNTATGVDLLCARLGDAVAVHPGIELTTYHGHALALGADRWLDWRTGLRGRTANDVARDVRDAGAFFVVAHPDAPPDDACTGCRWTYPDFDPSWADAVEVWGGLWDGPEERNQGCLDLWRSWLNAGHRLTATGATDAHRPEDWEGAVPLTYVRAADASLSAILEALRAGRTYVSSGPFLELRALRGGQVVGEVGDSVEGSSRPLLEARCHGRPPAELRLIANGRVFARQFVNGHGRLAVPADPGHSWYCAELWSPKGDVLLAVTSALYLA
jgi:hypothetical protein